MARKELFVNIKLLHKETKRDIPICKKALLEAEGDFYKAKNLLNNDPRYDEIKEKLSQGYRI